MAGLRCVARRGDQRPTSRENKQRQDVIGGFPQSLAIVAADCDHLNPWRIAMLKSDKLKLCLTASVFVAAVFWSGAGSAQDAVGALTGVIKDAAGAPVAGAFVQM
jgi:hypothetical protein